MQEAEQQIDSLAKRGRRQGLVNLFVVTAVAGLGLRELLPSTPTPIANAQTVAASGDRSPELKADVEPEAKPGTITATELRIVSPGGKLLVHIGGQEPDRWCSTADGFVRIYEATGDAPRPVIAIGRQSVGRGKEILISAESGAECALREGGLTCRRGPSQVRVGPDSVVISRVSESFDITDVVEIASRLGGGRIKTFDINGNPWIELGGNFDAESWRRMAAGPTSPEPIRKGFSSWENGGVLRIRGENEQGFIVLPTTSGFALEITNATGEAACTLRTDEYGNGEVGAWDRKGRGRVLGPGD